MLAEVLLVLSGHPSAFFIPSSNSSTGASAAVTTLSVSSSLADYLHPGEVASLNALGQLAFRYRHVRTWALDVRTRARLATLEEVSRRGGGSAKGKGRAEPESTTDEAGAYLSALATGVLGVLKEYELLIVEMEARVLKMDPELVQDGRSYVPLSAVVATFDQWQPVLASLSLLVDTLSAAPTDGGSWTPGAVLQYLADNCDTGNARLKEIYTVLLRGVRALFLTHLVAFLLYGLTAPLSTPASPVLGIDTGPDPLNPAHRSYKLNVDLIPRSIGSRTRESILYVGRVAATLKREGQILPASLVEGIRKEIMGVESLAEGEGLDAAISRARSAIGEWLWQTILTGSQITAAVETFANYFLLRKADFALAVIRDFHHLQRTRLLSSNPRSSTSVIRDSDLDTAMLRASLGTTAEVDPALDKLSWKLENGPLRPIMPSVQPRTRVAGLGIGPEPASSARDLFSPALLSAPLELRIKIGWPLDLFMTPSAAAAYSEIHAYLFALMDAQSRVQDGWKRLSARHRQRPIGTSSDEVLARTTWGIVRTMLFFLDQIIAHFTFDIIDAQHTRLLDALQVGGDTGDRDSLSRPPSGISLSGSMRSLRQKSSFSQSGSRTRLPPARSGTPDLPSPSTSDGFDSVRTTRSMAPPTPTRASGQYLDFLTLRQMHARHLAFLREGLLLNDRNLAVAVRDILDTCKRLGGLVERWTNDDGLFDPLLGGEDTLTGDRVRQAREIGKSFNEQLCDFFRVLLESQNPVQAKDDASSNGTGGTSFSKTARTIQMSRLLSRQTSFSAASRRPAADATGAGQSRAPKERDEKTIEAEAAMSRHVEQLLLRLDFNGILTSWMSDEEDGLQSRNVLAEGGL